MFPSCTPSHTRRRPIALLGTSVALLGALAAPAAAARAVAQPTLQRGERAANRAAAPVAGHHPRASITMLATRPSVPLAPCADPAWLCGSVRVPVDRSRPAGRTIPIGFTIFPHTDPTSTATDALLVSDGGPGAADTIARGFRLFQFVALTDQRDLLLVDDRGTGTSAPIDCPDLQAGAHARGRGAFIAATGACGAQLGPDADRYGSGDVALDLEDVRRALGYPLLTYYAQSYGGVAVQAYAARFPDRLRGIVIDGGMPVTDQRHVWGWGVDGGTGLVRAITLTCRRAPACAHAHLRPASALADLARRVRRHPIDGAAPDLSGRLRRVHVDELALIQLATGQDLNQGELPAADRALAGGDPRPLLRLAAETLVEPGSEGDPTEYSSGDNAAAFCNDEDFVWKRSDPVSERREKFRRALDALSASAFAPFSKRAWADFAIPDACLRWPAPDRFTPAVPAGTQVTGIPTLLLAGDLDTIVPRENTRALHDVFPRAQFLDIAGARHPAAGWSDCARQRIQDFVLAPGPVPASCTAPAYVAPAVPAFPRTAARATAATPLPGDRSRRLDRRLATVVVRTVLDAWLRSFRDPHAVGTQAALRGGATSFDYATFPDHAVIHLRQSRFTGDVTVTGTTTWTYQSNALHLHVHLRGPHESAGTLTAAGRFGFGAPFDDFTVSGAINDRLLHATVPAN